ncbi:MAG: hypothetical protein AB1409_08210 [Pseudomonadota bacterium]
MATTRANIVISATDRASAVLAGIAGKMEKFNRSMSGFGRLTGLANVGAGLALIREQMGGLAGTWERLKTVTKWSAGLLAGVIGAGVALGRLGLSAAEAVDKIGDLSEKFQVDSEMLQVYGEFVREDGGSIEDAAAAIGKLKKSMNEAIHGGKEQAAAFAGVGISVEELRRMKPEQVMARLADAFQGSERDLAKQAVLLELMGKNGAVMMGAMNRGAEAYRKKLAEMREDGRIATEEQRRIANDFSNAWQRATGAFEGLKNMLGLDLAQALLPLIESARQWVVANRELIKSGFAGFLKHLPSLLENVWQVMQGVWAVVEKLAAAFKWLGHTIGMQNAVWLTLGGAIAAPLALFGLLIAKIAVLTVSLGTSLAGAMTALGPVITAVGSALKGTVLASVTSLTAALPALQAGLAKTAALLGRAGAVGAAAFAGWEIGTWLNENVVNPGVQKLTGDKDATLGTWLYDKLHPEEGKPAARMTAAQAAASQRQDIRNQVSIRIEGDTKARVTEMRSGSDQTQIDVMSGLSMVGS